MERNETLNCSFCNNATAEESLYQVPVGIIVLLSVLYGSISVVAVVGNSMVIWVVASSKTMQNVTNYFICNLALADVTIGFFAIPFEAALLQRWHLPDFMCAFCPFVQVLSVNVSVFTLTAVAVDRHRAILYPLSPRISKAKAKVIISGIWVVSLFLAAPMAMAQGVIFTTEHPNSDQLIRFCDNIHLEENVMLWYRIILVTLQYLIPLIIITWSYVRMARTLWGNKTPGNAQDERDATLMKNKQRVIKMLVVVVALFGICWLPLQVYNVLQHIFPHVNDYQYINILWFCFDWLAMSNSCYNPFIYNYYNEKFRREFQFRLHIISYRVQSNFKRNDNNSDKFTKSLRMSRYYNTRVKARSRSRSMDGQSVSRTSSTNITLSQSISFPKNGFVDRCGCVNLARKVDERHVVNN